MCVRLGPSINHVVIVEEGGGKGINHGTYIYFCIYKIQRGGWGRGVVWKIQINDHEVHGQPLSKREKVSSSV